MSIESVKKSSDFSKVYKRGESKVNPFLVVYQTPNAMDSFRIGISVSKKVGNSVVRNRTKRLIKEVCRLHTGYFKSGYDYVFVARVRMKDASYEDVRRAFLKLMSPLKHKG